MVISRRQIVSRLWISNFQKKFIPKAAAEIIEPELVLAPNPAFETTTASLQPRYAITKMHKALRYMMLQEYNATKQKVNGIKGEVVINISNLAAGTYIINLEADGKVIKTTKINQKITINTLTALKILRF